jgi:hypothetical protein
MLLERMFAGFQPPPTYIGILQYSRCESKEKASRATPTLPTKRACGVPLEERRCQPDNVPISQRRVDQENNNGNVG